MTARLTARNLNRTLLARQLLLDREQRPVADTVEHLVGLQAQNPTDPHYSLWSRLQDFDPGELNQLLLNRQVVRCWPMRRTVHLVTARDAKVLLPLTQPVALRTLRGNFRRRLEGLDLDEVAAFGRKLLEEQPRTRGDLIPHLTQRWPGYDRDALGYAATIPLPLVQPPPRGLWGQNGKAVLTPADTWLGDNLEPDPSPDTIVMRYLATYGPAGNADIRTWSGLTGVKEVTERLRPRLRTFRDNEGRELFDLPDAPLLDADEPTPVRFLPEFDNVFLSHADRSRIVGPDVGRVGAITADRTVRKLLIDGFVNAEWSLDSKGDETTLIVRPYRPLSPDEEADITSEGARLLTLVAPDGAHDITIHPPASPEV
ncbi:winged helix DNA-binding domain-containing protein [Actinobacteria bacterium YIM 96077]|uniref:Winged helix DNA-binding domain-containing protein n=1 Tax=Phytoactinopolyspora halophila TaxID=1981511 RepID=A0A329R0N1_9ACTN|nr:winged helix DNA-binding domain-containing protein [Phytoactinopolyspora halophila]AYY11431.1 winged helix DNA-binding domain-containing protein [Actinobacteria bacterium YIM 96077]RAW18087.1 winged helix DNA-binding domain-containing protein [Phytoactinopolyspora halophila]